MEEFIYRIENRSPGPPGKGTIVLEGEEHFHLSRVLRVKPGNHVLATDGNGTTCLCTIRKINRENTLCEIEEEYQDLNSPARKFWIGLSMLKPVSKIESAVEKCTEIGAAGFLLFPSKRSEKVRPRLSRLDAIARSAMKQSLQSRIPTIVKIDDMEQLVARDREYNVRVVLHEKSRDPAEPFIRQLANQTSVVALIGPEGGFTDEEIAFFKENGYAELSLGKSRLRSETAAIKIASLLSGS
ncbi:MAG TPA: RsmE family RNA methyltransferase [Candidatus Kryptonia bacterium]